MSRSYVSVEQAAAMPGLRIAFSRGVPGPWGEAVRAFFDIKRIPYTAVEQVVGGSNEALQAWTGQSSAPVAMLDEERPRAQWSEMLMLAERLAPEPRLVPRDEDQRALMFGLCHALAAEDGFGWSVRHLLLHLPDRDGMPPREGLRHKFSGGVDNDHAIARVKAVIDLLARRLQAQEAAGSGYLVGDALTAADIYWTTFSNMVVSMAPEQCPMPDYYRALATSSREDLGIFAPEILIRHRDRILADHFDLPMWF